jgi:biotin carboxyl carrier protein
MKRIEVKAETPGSVIRHEVAPGDTVCEDDPILTIESMKMEIPIAAPVDGRVVEILAAPGEAVATGQTVAVMEA